jgi:hypothetical protein
MEGGERMVELEMENRYVYECVGRMDREQPNGPTRRMSFSIGVWMLKAVVSI